jgi:hypothetical protein
MSQQSKAKSLSLVAGYNISTPYVGMIMFFSSTWSDVAFSGRISTLVQES